MLGNSRLKNDNIFLDILLIVHAIKANGYSLEIRHFKI